MEMVTGTGRRLLATVVALALAVSSLAITTARAATPSAVEIDHACVDAPDAGFDDTNGNTFEFEIDCLAWYDITQGTGDGSQYEPGVAVRRWQMATFIYRLAQVFDEQLEDFDLPSPSDQGFDDIDDLDQEFQDAINVLADVGVVEGKSSTRFDPFANVRRDQMASFLNRLQGAVQESRGDDPDGFSAGERFFPDVDSDNVHHRNVDGLASEGIVQGRADGRYHPAGPVTRGQMAAFIMRFVEVNVDAEVIAPKSDEQPTEEPTEDGTDLVDTEVVDANANGVVDLGDLLVLTFDGELDEGLGDSVDDVVTLTDGDNSVATLDCGNDRCLQGESDLNGEPLLGDDGILYVAVADDNLVELEAGDDAGLGVDSEVTDLGDGFLDADGLPVDIGDGGVLDVLDVADLNEDLLEDLLGDLLGDVLS